MIEFRLNPEHKVHLQYIANIRLWDSGFGSNLGSQESWETDSFFKLIRKAQEFTVYSSGKQALE
jgi:hypothetical protein